MTDAPHWRRRASISQWQSPRWLFQRMVKLEREIVRLIIEDNGPEEILRRISDPY
jgi:uncharacterized protein